MTSDNYRSLGVELRKLNKAGVTNDNDVAQLKELLWRVVALSAKEHWSNTIRIMAMDALSFLGQIPEMTKKYLNMDDGDSVFWETYPNYEEITERFRKFTRKWNVYGIFVKEK